MAPSPKEPTPRAAPAPPVVSLWRAAPWPGAARRRELLARGNHEMWARPDSVGDTDDPSETIKRTPFGRAGPRQGGAPAGARRPITQFLGRRRARSSILLLLVPPKPGAEARWADAFGLQFVRRLQACPDQGTRASKGARRLAQGAQLLNSSSWGPTWKSAQNSDSSLSYQQNGW